jgi:hypothetical protein
MSYTKIATETFTAQLYVHGSWGARDVGDQDKGEESTMDLYDTSHPSRGFIEWDIPSLEMFEEIGLSYEWVDGKRQLCDYDGIMALPVQAVDLMRKAGIVVPDEFDDRVGDQS